MHSQTANRTGDRAHLARAIDLAEASVAAGGGPFGALVVLGDRIVAEGTNRVTAALDPTAHAEIEAIRSACAALGRFELAGCTLYASCEPCPMCLGAVLWSRLDRVVFAAGREDAAAAGFDDRAFYDELTRPPERRRIGWEQLTLPEARAPFAAWAEAADRIDY